MASAVLSKRGTNSGKPAPKKAELHKESAPDSPPPAKSKPPPTTTTQLSTTKPSTKIKITPTTIPPPEDPPCDLDTLEFDTSALKAFWPKGGSLSDPRAVGCAAEELFKTGGKILLLESLAAIAQQLQSLTDYCDAEQAEISELEKQAESYASQAQQLSQKAELKRNALKKRIRTDLKD